MAGRKLLCFFLLRFFMPLQRLHISGYRSVRDLEVPLRPVTVITGANGTGKSNLYQALRLMAQAAAGRLARAVAEEGGTPSLLWAGGERVRYTKRKSPKRFTLGVETDSFSYRFAVGLPKPSSLPPGRSLFGADPEVKEERIWLSGPARPILMLDRQGPTAWLRNAEGVMDEYAFDLLKYESVLPQIVEAHRYPEIHLARQTLLDWRFYHHFRTDLESPLRSPQIGVHTPVLIHDGSDLAAALETILEIGDAEALLASVASAFRGARLRVEAPDGLFRVELDMPGLLRPLSAREFSDGQLRYLCLAAALLSPRPPTLIALNEPETSLHPDLFGPLAQLIARAAQQSQIWVTTHASGLVHNLTRTAEAEPIELTLAEGETWLSSNQNTPRRPHRTMSF